MSSTPKIIYTCKYRLGYNNPDNKYKSTSYKQFLKKDAERMTGYYQDKEKEVVGMIDYYMGSKQERPVNLVLENGEYATEKEQEKIKKDIINATENSNLWKGVISFDNEWLTQRITLRDLEKILAKEVIPKFLKKCGFKDKNNMRYCFSLHGNTDNLHFHIAFVEMKPNYICKDGKISYRRKGKISENEKNYLKEQLFIAIERESVLKPKIVKLNKDIAELKKYFNINEKNFILKDINNIRMEEKIIKLGFLVDKYRNDKTVKKIKYGSIRNNELGSEIKKLTKEIKNYLFNNPSSDLFQKRKIVKQDLDNLNEYYVKVNKELHIETKIKNNQLVNVKQKYVDSYVLNSIINHALFRTNKMENIVKSRTSKNIITLDDLLQELAYEKSREYKGRNVRLIILKRNFNYMHTKYRFKLSKEIIHAVKNLNEEMNKEAKYFSKLFSYDDKYKQ